MGRAIVCALIVLVAGYFGSILGVPGCILAVGAAATGCIVYELEQILAMQESEREKEQKEDSSL